MSLNVWQSLRSKTRALSYFIQFFSFLDVIWLNKIASLPESFSILLMYVFFSSLTNRKCVVVAILVRRDDSYAFHWVEIRGDGRGLPRGPA